MYAEKASTFGLTLAFPESILLSVLRQRKLLHITVDRAAVNACVALGVQLNCPVLSTDSMCAILEPYWSTRPSKFAFLPFEQCQERLVDVCDGQYLLWRCFLPDRGDFGRIARPLRPLLGAIQCSQFCFHHLSNRLPWLKPVKGAKEFALRVGQVVDHFLTFENEPLPKAICRIFGDMDLLLMKELLSELSYYGVDLHECRFLEHLGIDAKTGPYCKFELPESDKSAVGEKAVNLLQEQAPCKFIGFWPQGIQDAYRGGQINPRFLDGVYSNAVFIQVHNSDTAKRGIPAGFASWPIRQLIYSTLLNAAGKMLDQGRHKLDIQELSFDAQGTCHYLVPVLQLSTAVTPKAFLEKHLKLPEPPKSARVPFNSRLVALGHLIFTWFRLTASAETKFTEDPLALSLTVASIAALKGAAWEEFSAKCTYMISSDAPRIDGGSIDPDLLFGVDQYLQVHGDLEGLVGLLNAINENYAEGLAMCTPAGNAFPSGRFVHLLGKRLKVIKASRGHLADEACRVGYMLLNGTVCVEMQDMIRWLGDSLDADKHPDLFTPPSHPIKRKDAPPAALFT